MFLGISLSAVKRNAIILYELPNVYVVVYTTGGKFEMGTDKFFM